MVTDEAIKNIIVCAEKEAERLSDFEFKLTSNKQKEIRIMELLINIGMEVDRNGQIYKDYLKQKRQIEQILEREEKIKNFLRSLHKELKNASVNNPSTKDLR